MSPILFKKATLWSLAYLAQGVKEEHTLELGCAFSSPTCRSPWELCLVCCNQMYMNTVFELLGLFSFSGDSSCWVGLLGSGDHNPPLQAAASVFALTFVFCDFPLESHPSGSSGHVHCCLHTTVLHTGYTAHIFCRTWMLLCCLLCHCCPTQEGTCCCLRCQSHVSLFLRLCGFPTLCSISAFTSFVYAPVLE